MRDRDAVDAELCLLVAVRRYLAELGSTGSTSYVDALLDERLTMAEEDPSAPA